MPDSDFLQLDRAHAPRRGVAQWLRDQLRSAILDGRLSGGSRLPSTRSLAAELAVARGVIVEAYQRLVDEGLISAVPRSGYVVVHRPTTAAAPHAPIPLRLPGAPYRASDIEIDLSPGRPDLDVFPRKQWIAAERAVLRDTPSAQLGYGDPRGADKLRRTLAPWLAATRGLRAQPEDILIVSGVAQALSLIAQVAVRRGTPHVAVEDPGSRGAHDELRFHGCQLHPIAVDEHGIDATRLSAAHDLACLTPAHQFPTGSLLSPERRSHVLRWARTTDAAVIEDDYDAEHRFDRAPVPALQGTAPEHVIYTGSTSKSLAPAMRLGWMVAPRTWQAELIEAKYHSDLGCATIPQLVLAELIGSGFYTRHLRAVRARLRARRDSAIDAIRVHLPGCQIRGIAAGLHLVVELPENGTSQEDGADVALATAARTQGVLVQPLSLHRHEPGPPSLVIGYASHTPARLNEAISRVATALSEIGADVPSR